MDTSKPFETFEHTAFRLEGLAQYIVAEEVERFRTFLKTGEVRITDTEWPVTVADAIAQGKTIERLRLLSEKLSEYERFELQAYAGPASGERIHTVLRKDYEAQYRHDFWFFDDKWIGLLHYTEAGAFIGMETREATDKEIHAYQQWRQVFQTAQPLKQVPFVTNTPDDTHCLQAAYMSIAKYFDKDFAVPMDEWAALTGYEEGKGSWANAGPVWFIKNGYEVKHYETFDFEAFIDHPKEYMIKQHGVEAGTWGYENTNIPAEIERMKALVASGVVERREPTMADVKNFIDQGYLVRITINWNALTDEDGYAGHAIVITGYNDTYIQFHDPGLPAYANRQVSFNEMKTAWSDQAKELDAIRRKQKHIDL